MDRLHRWLRGVLPALLVLLGVGWVRAQPPFYRIGAPYPPLRDPNLTTDNGIPGTGSYYYRDYPWPSLREALREYGLFGWRFRARRQAATCPPGTMLPPPGMLPGEGRP